MAMTVKSTQDHFGAAFGQIDEGIRSATGNDVLLVGGVMQGTATAVEDGDAAMLHFDTDQSLVAAGNQIKAQAGTVTIVSDNTYKNGTTTVTLNGLMKSVTFVTPNMEATDSTNFQMYDPNNYSIWSSGTVAESSTTTVNFGGTALDRPLYGTTTIIAVAEGTQSAERAIPFVIKVMK